MFKTIELRFLYENEKAIKAITPDGKKEVFLNKLCLSDYSEKTCIRGKLYEFKVMECVLKQKGLV